jgi:single-stranded-DNA-specific exonuclease
MWNDPLPITVTPELQRAVGGNPLVSQVLASRGLSAPERALGFLDSLRYSPTPPEALPDLVIVSEALDHACRAAQTVLVWGDFDVDGQTATALLADGLRRLGCAVAFYVPNRLRESHGIRLDSLKAQLASVRPGVLLTCDTGISERPAIEYAKSQGVVVLITDHHDLPPSLPAADATVNPKRLPPGHPLASLPGVGVAYKLLEHLYAPRGRADETRQFLDLVALGIVADVAAQTDDTRYLLQIGLERLREMPRIGLRALMETAGVDPGNVTANDIGFQLGPRLNAAGRLDDARRAVELLTTDDPAQARLIALQLEGLNNQRRLQERQILAAAQDQIAQDSSALDWEALVLSHAAWHPGIIGIVASRLAERYHRPVVLFALSEDGSARGSARSAPGYDIGAAIAAQADLLLHYGGHPGAAGLSLNADNIPAFRRRLSNTLRETHDPDARPTLILDAYVTFDQLSRDLAADLNRLAPFGAGNPPVTLATRDLTLRSAAQLGRSQGHRRLTVEDSLGNRQKVLWWDSADQPLPDSVFDLAYQIDVNTYEGTSELQLVLLDYRRSESAPIEVAPPRRRIIDYRGAPYPDAILTEILDQYPGALVWAEGYPRPDAPGVPLSGLSETNTLVVRTTPNGPQALLDALERAKASTVVLLSIDPPAEALLDLLKSLAQLVTSAIQEQAGRATLTALAEALGHSPTTVRLALDYFSARGEIEVEYRRGGALTLALKRQPPSEDADGRLEALKASLAETAAYRAFFQRASPEQLLGEGNEP